MKPVCEDGKASVCVLVCVVCMHLQFFMPSGCRPFRYKARVSGVVQGIKLCWGAISQEKS